ncbi:MAG: ATP-binding cassette domain-containing protein [Chloroflexales bacterium]|nr:ATP-binding cassette domain-containing protein [Chloroflexales bacterium]
MDTTRDPHPIVLDVQELSKTFVLHERDKQLVATQRATIRVYAGQLTALVGPSGAGKSSILKSIYRTYLPTSGSITYHTASGALVDLATADDATVVALRRAEISFVTQFFHCVPRQSTLDVVGQRVYERSGDRAASRARARLLLEQVGLPEQLWSLPPATFSGGEKQRVNLARELVRAPRLLLLDEPTASLDSRSVHRVVQLLQQLKRAQVGMLAIFHDHTLVEQLADHIVELAAVPKGNS